MMPPVTRRPLFWIAAVAALFLMTAAAVFTRSLNLDVAWHLYLARAVRGGARLYRDVADTNPPLIVFLNMLPVWLTDVLRLSPAHGLNLFVIAAAAGSVTVCSRLIPRIWTGISPEAVGLIVAAVAFCVMPFVKFDFGQREHFAVLLLLPYVWLAAVPGARIQSRLGPILIGVAGGLGFVMKPHFLLAWGLLELMVIARERFSARALLRPAFIAALATALGYVAFIVLFVPAYLEVFNDVRRFYGGLDSPVSVLVRLPDVGTWIAAAALLTAFRLQADAARPVFVLFAVATGFVAAGLLQFKGWSYHMYPGRVFLVLYFIVLALALLQSAPALQTVLRGGLRSVCLVIVGGLLATSARYLAESRNPTGPDLVAPLVELINKQSPHGPIAQISMRTQLYPAFPAAIEAGVKWSLRFPTQFYLPGLYEKELELPDSELSFRAPSAMSEVERRYFTEFVDNLCAAPPSVLIIEPPTPHAPAGRRSLDLVAYYGQDPRFRQLFAGYTPIGRLGSFNIYGRGQAFQATRPCESTP
jgi:hypothetical protein